MTQIDSLLKGALQEVAADAGSEYESQARLGVDVVDIAVFDRQLRSDIGGAFAERIFTAAEIADARGNTEKFALRWAVKEAVSKAIGTGFREGLRPLSIEVVKAASGSIRVAPADQSGWPYKAEQWTWSVSAAHEAGLAVAVALALPETFTAKTANERKRI